MAVMPIASCVLGGLAMDLARSAGEPGAGPDALIAPLIVGLGALVCGYLTLTSLVMLAAAVGGAVPRWAAALAPHAWRRLVATAAGVTLSTGIAVPSFAVDAAPGWNSPVTVAGTDWAPGWVESPAVPQLTTHPQVDAAPGWQADASPSSLAVDAAGTADTAPATNPGAPPASLTVEAGDSLWTITADLLGDQDAHDIASAWPALYEANRVTIGDDPGLIQPGQVLAVPAELAR
ncbi:LysM peptidoglycan-binding domain-containing protein [Demequina capsici]|uniref:LysM peptidoglycan-binding domain-containing protein n=1 Tax=Demequina capsici TaxID=3075620 RepID=A0AA96J9S6_9MICO|nr:LysM peptidoglycan-binding domain-containing protein [Demequina sp. PMTSA13]WNM26700.1 LysM peptidoglycan-binding domain-containing protein [Demequina sp. PMTSA13]